MTQDRSMEERMARLEAVEEIKQLKARYFRYLDLHWWDELRGLFADDAQFDIAESRSKPADPDSFIASASAHLTSAMTVHHGHMPEITILDDEHAHGVWAMYDLVEPSSDAGYPVLSGYGHYTESYRRVDGQWRIASLRLSRLRRSVDGRIVDGASVSDRRPFVEP